MGNSSSRFATIQQRARGNRARPRDLAKPTEQHIAHPPENPRSQPQGGEERARMGWGRQRPSERGEGRVRAAGEAGNENKWQDPGVCVCVCLCVTASVLDFPSFAEKVLPWHTYEEVHTHRKLESDPIELWHKYNEETHKCVCACVCVSHSLLDSRVF